MAKHLTRRTALKSIFCGAASLGMPGLRSKQGVSPGSSPVEEIERSERSAMAVVAEDYRRKFDAPGLAVVIARDGRLAYAQAFGVTGHDSREQLTTSNLFRIASVSKPITSAAIFSLMERATSEAMTLSLENEASWGQNTANSHTAGASSKSPLTIC